MPAVVLLSGGQDSTTCLAWALSQLGYVKTVSFFYGQRHNVELEQAKKIASLFHVEHAVLPVEALHLLGGAALTNDKIEVEAKAGPDSGNQHAYEHGLPSTFVPGRNLLFFTLAAAFGAKFGIYDLVTGVCEADASGYPDCRELFVHSAQRALTNALDQVVNIHAPLLQRNKAATWLLAEELGVLDVIVRETHTCYNGVHDKDHFHAWGYGCGECPACNERRRGYEEAFLVV